MKKLSLIVTLILVFVLSANIVIYAAGEDAGTDAGGDNSSYKQGYDDGYDEGYSEGRSSVKSRTPIIRLVETMDTPEVEAGEKLEINVTFKNDSNYPASSLVISPQFEDNAVLVYERPLTYRHFGSLSSKKEIPLSFSIKTSSTAKPGTYPLKFKIEFKNSLGENFTREESAYFKINSEKSKPILNISNIKVDKANVAYGDRFCLSFDINNIGGSEAKETELKLTGFATETIMPISSRDYAYIGTIEDKSQGSKSTSSQTFEFQISPDIEVRDVAITATLTYKSYDDKELTTTKAFYITGITPKPKPSGDEEKKKKEEEPKYAKPKMIITSYRTSSNNIIAGDEFNFSFSCKNTSKEKNIRNIKITIGTVEGSFIITNGSNTFYVESLETQGVINRQLNLKAKQSLLSNSYPINIDFDYEDYDGVEYTAKETVNIPVTEFSKLVINSANADSSYVGAPTALSFEYANMGKAEISNLVATCEGDFVPVQENTYIGNLAAGNSDNYDIEVKATKVGKNVGTLVLTFENSSGKQIRVTRDFEAEAMEEELIVPTDMELGNMGEDEAEKAPTFEAWQIVLAGLGSLLVSFIVVRFITKKIILKRFEDEL